MGGAALAESALGLGTFVPGETLVAIGAGSLSDGRALWAAWLVVALGAFEGDHVGYLIGRRAGPAIASSRLVRRLGAQHWRRATGLVHRFGAPALVIGRLVPGVRTLLGLTAGALGMRYRRYVLASCAAAGVWSGVWVWGGSTLGQLLTAIELHEGLILAGILMVAVVVGRFAIARRTRGEADGNAAVEGGRTDDEADGDAAVEGGTAHGRDVGCGAVGGGAVHSGASARRSAREEPGPRPAPEKPVLYEGPVRYEEPVVHGRVER